MTSVDIGKETSALEKICTLKMCLLKFTLQLVLNTCYAIVFNGTTVSIVENLEPQDLQILRLHFPFLLGLVFSTSDLSHLHLGQLIIV